LVGSCLQFFDFAITGQGNAEHLRSDFDLLHGANAVALVVVVTAERAEYAWSQTRGGR